MDWHLRSRARSRKNGNAMGEIGLVRDPRADNLFGMKERSVRSIFENGFENGFFFFLTFGLLTIVIESGKSILINFNPFLANTEKSIFMNVINSFYLENVYSIYRESKENGD